MKTIIKAVVNPTEDRDKVEKAIRNIFPALKISEIEDGRILVGEGEGKETLEEFRLLLRSQRIRDSARTLLISSLKGTELSFKLNKQAAFMGAINFVESNDYSYLGSIEVTVKDVDVEFIEWLTSKNGGKEGG
ncbi:MAG: RNA-binding domain-containing protein [Candidatus Hydrothermarchaeales archaeon]